MNKVNKSAFLSKSRADPDTDISLVNEYAVTPLTPEDVYCFSVALCNNDVDRDGERFTDDSLEKLAKLFKGKTGIYDHSRSAKNQIARLYRTEVEQTTKKNALGEPLKVLQGSAYLLRTDSNADIIKAIDGGIMKEVSVGCALEARVCSICGKKMSYNWVTGKTSCEDGHEIGKKYDGKLCCGELINPIDAYEFSFVAVPAQKGAGVTKSAEDLAEIVELFKSGDVSGLSIDDLKAINSRILLEMSNDEDRKARAEILAENTKYLLGREPQ